jgi:sulfatase modifying factor 1
MVRNRFLNEQLITNQKTPMKIATTFLTANILALFYLTSFVYNATELNKINKDEVTQKHNITIAWASIPAGSFTMGSASNEDNRNDNETQHQVTLSAFKMSKNEITFEQYDAFCEATNRRKPSDERWGRGKRPVINVSWIDANAFAVWMGCRLPTEAEWEYACRAGKTTPFNTGNNITIEQANYDGNYPYNKNTKDKTRGKTIDVGSFAPNDFGLYDMHGNVFEWCSDWYGNYPSTVQTNPAGPSNGFLRVFRGGSWGNSVGNCRAAGRSNYCIPNFHCNLIGFRLVYLKP